MRVSQGQMARGRHFGSANEARPRLVRQTPGHMAWFALMIIAASQWTARAQSDPVIADPLFDATATDPILLDEESTSTTTSPSTSTSISTSDMTSTFTAIADSTTAEVLLVNESLSLTPASANAMKSTSAWWNSAWSRRLKLPLDNRGNTAALVDFPLMVRLNSARVDFSRTQDGGQDVRFVDANGSTVLSHEIERWNEASECIVWVRVPQIDANTASDFIWLYYGNSTAADAQSPASVWNANFVAVHHLEETSAQILDSTSLDVDGEHWKTTMGNSARLGSGAAFNGVDSGIELLDLTQLSLTSGLTISAWVNTANASSADLQTALGKGNSTTGLNYLLGIKASNPVFCAITNEFRTWTPQITALQSNTWYHICAVHTASTNNLQIFVDGIRVLNTTAAALTANQLKLFVGQHGSGAYFNGQLDEIRVSNVARSSAWVTAEHRAMNDNLIIWPETGSLPTLWCVDKTTSSLYSIQNYRYASSNFKYYGKLKYSNNGTVTDLPASVDGIAIDPTGSAYVAINAAVGGYSSPVLGSIQIDAVSPSANVVVKLHGQIGGGADSVMGLSIDPTSGALYALRASSLCTIDKSSGAVASTIGSITGSGQSCTGGLDLAFDDQGQLYVLDGADDHLYLVNKSTAAIIGLLDQDTFPVTGKDHGLAWDSVKDRLIGSNTKIPSTIREITMNHANNKIFSIIGTSELVASSGVVTTTVDANVLNFSDTKAIAFDGRTGTGGTDVLGVRVVTWVEAP